MRRLNPYLAPVAVILLLLGAWELAARWDLISNALNIQDFLVPAPSEIATSLWRDRSLLADDGWVTLREVLLGFLCALVAGLVFAVVLHLSETLRRAFYPLLVASQAIPPVAIAPILVVWFGFGIGPKLLLIALVCFFPITVNTLDGLRSVDPQLITMMRTLGASRAQILGRVELPSALPFFFSGTRIAIAVAVIGALFAEWAGADSGLGTPGADLLQPAADRKDVRCHHAAWRDGDRPLRPGHLDRAPGRHLGRSYGDTEVEPGGPEAARSERRAGGRRGVPGTRAVRMRRRRGCDHRIRLQPAALHASTSTGTSTPTTLASTARSTAATQAGRPRRAAAGPSDPSAPIKEVAAGRADLAVPMSRRCCSHATRGSTSRRWARSSISR